MPWHPQFLSLGTANPACAPLLNDASRIVPPRSYDYPVSWAKWFQPSALSLGLASTAGSCNGASFLIRGLAPVRPFTGCPSSRAGQLTPVVDVIGDRQAQPLPGTSAVDCHHRCQPPRLGGPPGPSVGSRSVVALRTTPQYQPPGVTGHRPGPSPFS